MSRGIRLNRDLRSIRRFWTIVETVGACGFRELADTYFPEGAKGFFRRRKQDRPELRGLDRPAKLRRLLEELGPTFVKFGQILSTRPDLIGPVWAGELRQLTENVAPFPFAEVKAIIERETGRKTDEIFSRLEEKPLAAASIGQVHEGILLGDGARVVVKVRRPGIAEVIEQDLEIMRFIAVRIEESGGALARFRPVRIVEEFARSLGRELDYMIEAANLNRFAADSRDDAHIKVPQVYFEYTTTEVMVMEFIEGDSAAKVQNSPELRKKYDLEKIAEYGVNSLLHQIFAAGFFHADPHPGNILLLPDGRLCFIDFGMMGRINADERRIFPRGEEQEDHAHQHYRGNEVRRVDGCLHQLLVFLRRHLVQQQRQDNRHRKGKQQASHTDHQCIRQQPDKIGALEKLVKILHSDPGAAPDSFAGLVFSEGNLQSEHRNITHDDKICQGRQQEKIKLPVAQNFFQPSLSPGQPQVPARIFRQRCHSASTAPFGFYENCTGSFSLLLMSKSYVFYAR